MPNNHEAHAWHNGGKERGEDEGIAASLAPQASYVVPVVYPLRRRL